jgi:hypothetical protein
MEARSGQIQATGSYVSDHLKTRLWKTRHNTRLSMFGNKT